MPHDRSSSDLDRPDSTTDLAAGKAARLVLPYNTFTDPDGQALAYAVTLYDGSALPSWLSFAAVELTAAGFWRQAK